MRIRRIISIVTFCLIASTVAFAQNETEVDTTIVENPERTYERIMENLQGQVTMSDSLRDALEAQIEKNKGRRSSVYRIRIYFDNSQNARNTSTEVVDTFKVYYPDIPVYRSYSNPYFKVTVGDFRTKSDAMRFLEAIRPKYPTVFLVKETFSTI